MLHLAECFPCAITPQALTEWRMLTHTRMGTILRSPCMSIPLILTPTLWGSLVISFVSLGGKRLWGCCTIVHVFGSLACRGAYFPDSLQSVMALRINVATKMGESMARVTLEQKQEPE